MRSSGVDRQADLYIVCPEISKDKGGDVFSSLIAELEKTKTFFFFFFF